MSHYLAFDTKGTHVKYTTIKISKDD